SVLSGHIGGANALTKDIAAILGAEPVITTQSDNANMWALDILGDKFNWVTSVKGGSFNECIATYVNGGRIALLLNVKSNATAWMERTKGSNVEVFYNFADIPCKRFNLIIAVTPYLYVSEIPMITYVPKVLYLGVGCRKNCNPIGIFDYIIETLKRNEINPLAIASVSTIDIKKDEPLVKELGIKFNSVNVFSADDLKDISVPNPSEKAFEVTGIYGVAESAAIKSAYGGRLLVEKQKGSISGGENNFTFAVA
ncbi:MAG: cobalamin biosynthesis protein, partial [Bacteroidales bacterium]